MKTNTSTQPTTKSIILVGGDKGGVGKSTVARALVDFLSRNGVRFTGYDGDDTNPTFLRFFPDAVRIHTKNIKGFEPLINALESDAACHVVDLGAGTSIVLGQFAEQTGFLELVSQYGARVVVLFVLAPGADSIGLLKTLSEQYGEQVAYVVARSNAIPGTWDLWEGSKARKRLLDELGAVEITIPALDAEAFSLVDRHSLKWSATPEDKRLSLATRSYVRRWLAKVFAEFEKAKVLSP